MSDTESALSQLDKADAIIKDYYESNPVVRNKTIARCDLIRNSRELRELIKSVYEVSGNQADDMMCVLETLADSMKHSCVEGFSQGYSLAMHEYESGVIVR